MEITICINDLLGGSLNSSLNGNIANTEYIKALPAVSIAISMVIYIDMQNSKE